MAMNDYLLHNNSRLYEKWLWIELIGFDNTKSDFGIGEFLSNTGFIPDAVSFLIMNPDFIHMHNGIREEKVFPPDYCSYGGRPCSEERERQSWTNYRLKGLIDELHKYKIEIYCSFFNFSTSLIDGKIYNSEWSSNHPELFEMKRNGESHEAINPLRRLEDKTYYENFLIKQLVKVLNDYGFDGFHGADGYTSLRLPLALVDYSDDMVDQFMKDTCIELPSDVSILCEGQQEAMERRADWILKNRKIEWINFYSNRTERLWRKIITALHKEGKKVVFNTAWTRDPFEALYRYGVDYKRIAQAGVDGFIVETVEPVLSLGGYDLESDSLHYDFMAMLMLIKVYAPEAKLIHLNVVHDGCEQWDVLHHAPTVLEREIYTIANLYLHNFEGKLKNCSSGPMVCLSDSIKNDEWKWLQDKWNLGFSTVPEKVIGATLVWSDNAFERQIKDFIETRRWTPHKIVHELMAKGVPVRSAVNINYLDKVRGVILVTNPHLLSEEELGRVLAYKNGPIVIIGGKVSLPFEPDFEFEDAYSPNQLFCATYGTGKSFNLKIEKKEEEGVPDDLMAVRDPDTWLKGLYFRRVSDVFLQNCVRLIIDCSSAPIVLSETNSIKVTAFEVEKNHLRIFVENDSYYYITAQIDIRQEIENIKLATQFPLLSVITDGSKFSVKVPGRGIVVLDVSIRMII